MKPERMATFRGTLWLAPRRFDNAFRRDGSREQIQDVIGFNTELDAWLVAVMNDRGHVANTKGRTRTMYVRKWGAWFQVTKRLGVFRAEDLSPRQRSRLRGLNK